MNPLDIYQGSDAEATKALYARLETLGPAGVIALNLFRAQKCSSRAKVYRRGAHKRDAYDRKNWSLGNLVRALAEYAGDPSDHSEFKIQNSKFLLPWGWKEDPAQEFHRWVLYVDLPTGQVSFHAASPIASEPPAPPVIATPSKPTTPRYRVYAGDWDGQHLSAERILRYVAAVLHGEPLAAHSTSNIQHSKLAPCASTPSSAIPTTAAPTSPFTPQLPLFTNP